MNSALILTAHVDNPEQISIDFSRFDTVICADGGLLVADRLGLTPDILIGDFDSVEQPKEREVIKLPAEKDMTDSEAAIDLAVSQGYDHIVVLGGLGGRFDHTMGNIGILSKYCGKLSHLALTDGQNYVFMASPGRVTIPRGDYTYLGVISYGGAAKSVTLKGVKYPLTDYLLSDSTTLGVSNEIIEETAEISFTEGKLLLILSRDSSSHR
ncbi:MAG: thiamine diphosphokinase [Anaerovoracaceae bacterium]